MMIYSSLGPVILRTLIIVLGILIIISLWGFYFSIRPSRITSSLTPRTLDLFYEDIRFKTHDNLTLSAWFIPAASFTKMTIILLHGYPADKGNILPTLAFLQKDFNLFLFDFRYLGTSEGMYSTAGAKEVEDLLAAIRYLKTKGINKVGIWGFSMGGAVGLMSIPRAPEIMAVISEASYASLDRMVTEQFNIPLIRYPIAYLIQFWAKIILRIDLKEVSVIKAVQKTKIPILLIHSSSDEVIPFSHARLIQKGLKNNPRAEFWFNENLSHGQLTQAHKKKMETFFKSNLISK